MAGASGGYISTTYHSGQGAKTRGYIYLEKGETLYFYVGGKGTSTKTANASISGGYNGGGDAKTESASGSTATSGGGATDVRLVGGEWDSASSLISRIMVAAGGAGSNNTTTYIGYGGFGGFLFGETGTSNQGEYYGTGGTQISGGTNVRGTPSLNGSFGIGGGGSVVTNAGSGGGGYYGGASGAGYRSGGGGGSSYISGYAGVNSVEESTTITHTNQTLHYSGKYFIGGKMIADQNEGNGYAKITYVGTKPEKKTTKLDNVRYIKNCISYGTHGNTNHWYELQAIKDGVNIAKGKSVIGTTSQSSSYPYSRITDGDLTIGNYSMPSSNATNQCITVDLGDTYDLDEIAVWNGFASPRSYYDNITSVSSDNKDFTEIIDEASIETSNGHRINAYTDTYNGYISDNLLLWYDGYANTGTTRTQTTTTWKDLSGTGNNATVSGATWYDKYLSFDGTNDYARTSSSINYNNSKAFTIQFVGTISPQTKRTILFESSANSNHNNGSFYINTNDFGTNEITLAMKYTTGNNHKMADNILNDNLVSYTISFDSTKEYNEYISIYKNIEEQALIVGGTEGLHDKNVSEKTLSNYVLYIASRAGTEQFTKMNINSIRIYNKALTEEELLHNYNYDIEKFNLE